MSAPELVVLVKFRSSLSLDEVLAVAASRIADFRALDGLEQKYYVQDAATGEFGGVYVWRSAADFDDYRQSALRASIADAYCVDGAPRVEVLRVVEVLREA